MRSPVSSFNSELKPEHVLAYIQEEMPRFNDIVDLDDGVYSALGDFAIYLRDGIAERSIPELELKAAFMIMNAMGEAEDLEVNNLLVVGMLEILTDVDVVADVVKKGLEGKAEEFFSRVLSGWI